MQGNVTTVIDWYSNKAYQCPQCHHDTVAAPSRWEVYTCCNCATRFARFPRLQRFLRHAGVTCEFCTERHPVTVDGEPFGFLRRRHNSIGMYTEHEAWLYDTDDFANHRDGVSYRSTRTSRAEAMADLAHWRSMFGPIEDDLSPVFAVVGDEQFDKYGPEVTGELRDALLDGTLEVYGVGALRAFTPPHPRRGQFYADTDTFTWGLIAPSGLEGIYTSAAPKSLAAHAPQL
ncbi:hypothetical protein GCM10009566_42250 [Streptomyces murinus]|uniref:DNA-directed RNA polymerase subunit RPC12/RpoP n=1 Tax=Streptomyces murinus TaxID=33900 RepID=A0A7W3RIF2_STRMR|nr:hypothetical protein [Streptomyces murinus]MBA9050835.1 DNA-directed RNA polymerase subunit RPC12/RpoP [Streptomyces murinus]